MALNLDLFKNVVAPEFASKTDSEILEFAAEAENELSETAWGKLYPRALALVTAHLMKMSANASSGITGELTSVKVGNLSRTYAQSSNNDNAFSLTTYGKEFLRIRKQIVKGPYFWP
jgi:hypothetical protein